MLSRLENFTAELSLAYMAAGRHVDDAELSRLSVDLCDHVPCPDEMVHDVFLKARELADIPTYRVLCDAYRSLVSNAPVIAALPKPDGYVEPRLRATFRRLAVRNFCIANGCYDRFVEEMAVRKCAAGRVEYVNPARAYDFEDAMVRQFSPMVYDFERGDSSVPSVQQFEQAIKGANNGI